MTVASFFLRRRRALVLFGAAALLHVLLIGALGGRIGIAPASPTPPPVIHAQLRMAPAPPALAAVTAPVPAPKPAAKPKPKPPRRPPAPAAPPDTAPAPAASIAAADAPIEAPAPATEPAPASDAAPASVASAPVQSGATETVNMSSSAQGADAAKAEAPPAAVALIAYKASIPPSTQMTLDVARTDADGTEWHGEMVMRWRVKGSSYSMKVEAGISMLITRLNLVVLTSEGSVDASGFVPATMTEKRRGRAQTATHFNHERQQITFSASEAVYAIEPGAQDKATLPLQLAAIARADPAQLNGALLIQVGEDKDAIVYKFDVLGQEEIDTRLGKLATWHLSRPPRAGVYGARLDVWLAPSRDWMPVRVRNTEASGAVTTQTVSKIEPTDTGH
jgi:hypothetical protein